MLELIGRLLNLMNSSWLCLDIWDAYLLEWLPLFLYWVFIFFHSLCFIIVWSYWHLLFCMMIFLRYIYFSCHSFFKVRCSCNIVNIPWLKILMRQTSVYKTRESGLYDWGMKGWYVCIQKYALMSLCNFDVFFILFVTT